MKSVRLDLPEDKHAELRVVAAMAGKSMSEYVRDLVLEAIALHGQGRPRKGK
jgi:plasmid stability protein